MIQHCRDKVLKFCEYNAVNNFYFLPEKRNKIDHTYDREKVLFENTRFVEGDKPFEFL